MNVNRIYLLLYCLCYGVQASAQIAGQVMDKNSSPLSFVNIVLLSLPDSIYLNGTISDGDGKFSFPENSKNKAVKISSVGYSSVCKSCSDGNVGTILLSQTAYELKTIEIKATLPRTRIKGDALVTTVQNSVLSKAGSASDVLSKIPGVLAKQNNTFEVFGKGTPLIYINGQQVRDLSELEHLNSENIKEVELVTNPGVRYDASIKSVIWITTLKNQGDGISFDLRSSYYHSSNTELVEQLNMNYRKKGLDVFGTFNFSKNAFKRDSKIEQTVWVDTLWRQKNINQLQSDNKRYRGIMGINYSINQSHSLGARYTISFIPQFYDYSITESIIEADGMFYDKWYNNQKNKTNNNPTHQLNLYYNGQLNKLKINWNTDCYIQKKRIFSYTKEKSQEKDDREVHSNNSVNNRLMASKLLLSYPLFDGELSFGGEYTHTYRKDDYANPENYVPTSSSLIKESAINAFVDYSLSPTFGKLAFGLRYEHRLFNYYENDKYMDSQSQKFDNYFPSISFSPNLGDVLQMDLSYTIKNRKPSYQQLSNNVYYMNRFTFASGNPSLKPEKTQDITLNSTWRFLQLTVSYQHQKDAIIYWSEQMAQNQAKTVVKYRNIDKLPSLSAYLSFNPKVNIWSPCASVGVYKQWLDIEYNHTVMPLRKPMYTFSLYNTIEFPRGFQASLDYTFQGSGDQQNIYLLGKQNILNFSIQKTFLKKALSIEMKVNDIFYDATYSNLAYLNQMRLFQFNRDDSRVFSLTVRYRFNPAKNKYKGVNAGESEINRF